MMVSLARPAVWVLQQAASLPDTVVMKQVPNARNWFDIVSGGASIVISIALIALAVGLLPAAWNFRKSYKKVNELLDRIYGDVNPIMRHASSVADNLNYVSTAVRQDVARLQATVAAANARLDEATRLTERRVHDFNALLKVVQGEAEDTFVSTAATIRGLRQGAATFRDEALGSPPFDADTDALFAENERDSAPPGRATTTAAAMTTPSQEADDDRTREATQAEDNEFDEFQDERPRIRRSRGRDGGSSGGAA